MLGLGLSLQKGVSAFNAGRALVSSYIRRVTDAGGVLQNTACDVAAINELNQDRLLEPASWVLVPDGIKEDVVYAQKPSSGLGDLVMTRASDATYTDSTGVVRRSPYNLLQQSEMFSNAIWTKVNSTISIDATVAPNGTLTADKLVATVINDQHRIDQTPTSLATSQTFSVYAKAGEYPAVGLRLGTTGAGFNLATGVVFSTSSGITSSIQSVGNGWYRCSITKATGVSNDIARINISDGVTAASNFAGNGTDGIFIWGAQLVEGTSALDYFPTTNRQDVPRIDFRNADGTLSSCGRLLLEPQRTNSIRNSSMVGAVAGSPGTLPTNWTSLNSGGLTRSVVAVGTENGLPYVDIRINGTATGIVNSFSSETPSGISALSNQVWSNSVYIKVIAQPNPPVSYILQSIYANSGAYVSESNTTYSPTATLRRFTATHTAPASTITNIYQSFAFGLTNGTAYDFTIRIAAPQMELGAYATTWVPTTTAAVTRLADAASKTGVSSLIGQTEGTVFFDINYTQNDIATAQLFSISDGTSANRVFCGFAFNTSLNTTISTGGVTQFTASTSALVIGTRYKAAVAYQQNNFAFYVNGVQIAIDLIGTVGSFNRIAFDSGAGASPYTGLVNQAALFPTRLTNDQLEVLTSEGYGNYALLAQSLNCVLQ